MTYGGTMDYHFVEGDQNSTLRVTCKRSDTGAVIDVSTSTNKLHWSINEGTKTISNMSFYTDGSDGILDYTWGLNELAAGILKCEVEITSGGLPLTQLEVMRFTVRERL